MKLVHLYLVFGILALGVIAMLVVENLSGKSNFKTDLVEVASAEIDKISIKLKGETSFSELIKTDSVWQISVGGKNFDADASAVYAMLSEIDLLKVERVAATKKEAWNKYFLADTSVIVVKLYKKNKPVTELFIGKFEYSQVQNLQQAYMQQPQFKLTTYVRTDDEETVYAINGMLNMTFGRSLMEYRNRTLAQVQTDLIEKVKVNYGGNSYLLEKQSNGWQIGTQTADSAKVADYLNTFAELKSSDFTELPAPTEPITGSVSFESSKLQAPVLLKIYGNSEQGKVKITGSQNTNAAFDALKNDLLSRIILPADSLLKK